MKEPALAETNVIRVRYWAAAKAAAGTDADDVPVDGSITLAELARRGRRAAPRDPPGRGAAACSTLVGDRPVGTADPATYVIEPGSSVEFLPPFAGG